MVTYIRLMTLIYILGTGYSYANTDSEEQAIEYAAKSYLIAQIKVRPELMDQVTDDELIKRTYWQDKAGQEFIMAMDKSGLVKLAAQYNLSGDRFVKQPKVEVKILDIDGRIATVKLVADDWIDYMHLYKAKSGNWQILNVLWQFNQLQRHASN
ncbi:nuclear transport factor 2 family protein [Pseudoalteromonas sp. OOF1S-7]|uniref:nuclear transport factor 2 family protein n=1 Tax=Pseudoalteromonas sp. OOF1S-7 TaxID=2917757 RepID=UPI001EF607FD|nr:nuclear transport factor 2 family protein [Pseudoalteromonas sp. OOF1S-7]MCG7536920.1 nuclear transport factor 2 family protein [Pseudoalteromonas sp. OOF1S-7]